MSAAWCQGGCGRAVTDPGKWCSVCFFAVSTGAAAEPEPLTSHQIREQILRAAFVLRFGTQTEQSEALETLSHLVTDQQKEKHNATQSTR